MPVYVDPPIYPFGRMLMCHMWADTLEELHAMADQIGGARKWFQHPPKASWEHYDISKGKRAQAIRLGAIETDRYAPVYFLAQRRGDSITMAQIDRLRASRRTDTPS